MATDITRSGTCKVGVHKTCAMSNCKCECHFTDRIEEIVKYFESLHISPNNSYLSRWLRTTLKSFEEEVREEENRVPTGDNFAQEIVSRWEQAGRMEALDEVEKSVSASKIAYEGNKKPLHKGTEDLVEYIVGLSKKTFLRTIADLKKK